MTRNNKYEGTIGSATAVMKSNGEIFAKPHPHKLTGYKAKNSETNTKTLGSSTYEQLAAKRMHQPAQVPCICRTYKEFFNATQHKPSEGAKPVPGPLVPYHENAMRNR